ncbi:uncharacterized protein LOC128239369 isoform X2 [Mya arenaria]|nr:uncharacterized protein LOC128239369 isoform X2 [Mya arenaria]
MFRLTVKHEIKDPCFSLSLDQIIEEEKTLEYYMRSTWDKYPKVFTTYSTTYFKDKGYFIDSINGVAGDWDTDRSFWEILNFGQPLHVGVSFYVPKPGDNIVFNFTKSETENCTDQETATETPSNMSSDALDVSTTNIQGATKTGPNFRYTVRNQRVEPAFLYSIRMRIEDNQPLIYYMEKACDKEPEKFKYSATYFPELGYFIDSIKGVAGDRKTHKSSWKIFNFSQLLNEGVSSYIPCPDDEITINFEYE